MSTLTIVGIGLAAAWVICLVVVFVAVRKAPVVGPDHPDFEDWRYPRGAP